MIRRDKCKYKNIRNLIQIFLFIKINENIKNTKEHRKPILDQIIPTTNDTKLPIETKLKSPKKPNDVKTIQNSTKSTKGTENDLNMSSTDVNNTMTSYIL